jgi:hypothetical protein
MDPRLIVLCSIFLVISLLLVFLFFYKRNDKKEFIKFTKKMVMYALPIFFIVFIYYFAEKPYHELLNGISSSDQLIQSFKNSISSKKSIYIYGNSRCYRGINPYLISKSSFNFSYDNETFLEQYFKIEYLRNHKIIPDTIILGVDYFEFSFVSTAMSDIYKRYFTPEYLHSIDRFNQNEGSNKVQGVNEFININLSNLFGRSASQYFYYLYNKTVNRTKMEVPYLKENGQYIINPIPKAGEGDFLKRDTNILNIQRIYFEKILSFSLENNVIVFLVMPPLRNIERRCYKNSFIDEMDKYFISKCKDNRVFYINYFERDYDLTYFMDDTHLNPSGADKFSIELRNDINKFNNISLNYLFVK